MMINPVIVWHTLFVELTRLIDVAKSGVERAHETATNDANVAENKYDTLGLEASYLAHGQQERLAQCIEDNAMFDELFKQRDSISEHVILSSIVTLVDDNEQIRYLLIGPSAGGLKIQLEELQVLVITPQSPIGAKLMGKEIDDEVSLNIGDNIVNYAITAIN